MRYMGFFKKFGVVTTASLLSLSSAGCFTQLGEGIVSGIFRRKEDTKEIMKEAFKEAIFNSSNSPKIKFTEDNKRLSEDGDYFLTEQNPKSALEDYIAARDLDGIEATVIVFRDKNYITHYLTLSQLLKEEGFNLNPTRGYINATKRGYVFEKPESFFLSDKKEEYEEDYFKNSFTILDTQDSKRTASLEEMLDCLHNEKLIIFDHLYQFSSQRKNIEKILNSPSSTESVFLFDMLYNNESIKKYNKGEIREESLWQVNGIPEAWNSFLEKSGYNSLLKILKSKNIDIVGTRLSTNIFYNVYEWDTSLVKQAQEQLANGKKIYICVGSSRAWLHHLPFLLEKETGTTPAIVSQNPGSFERYEKLKNNLARDKVLKVGDKNWFVFSDINSEEDKEYHALAKEYPLFVK